MDIQILLIINDKSDTLTRQTKPASLSVVQPTTGDCAAEP